MSRTAKLYKAACGLNLAVLLRTLRFGPRAAVRRAVRAYDVIDPLAREKGREPWDDPRGSQGLEPSGQLHQDWPLGGDYGQAVRHHRRLAHLRRWITRNSGPGRTDELAAAIEEPEVVLEIGTYNGATTRLIALNLPRAKIHTLDLPPDISSEELHQSKLPKDDFHLIAIDASVKRSSRTRQSPTSHSTTAIPRPGISRRCKGSISYSSTAPIPTSISGATRSAVQKRPPGGPPLSGTTSTIAITTSYAISPKWRMLACRCVTSR